IAWPPRSRNAPGLRVKTSVPLRRYGMCAQKYRDPIAQPDCRRLRPCQTPSWKSKPRPDCCSKRQNPAETGSLSSTANRLPLFFLQVVDDAEIVVCVAVLAIQFDGTLEVFPSLFEALHG